MYRKLHLYAGVSAAFSFILLVLSGIRDDATINRPYNWAWMGVFLLATIFSTFAWIMTGPAKNLD